MGLIRRLFGPKKPSDSTFSPSREQRRPWSSVGSSFNACGSISESNGNKRDALSTSFDENNLDAIKQAIAVAAATAAAAEAAIAAARAAAEAVRLTGGGCESGRCSTASAGPSSTLVRRRRVEELAVVKIQSFFRGYLARRALRVLKALVKLQSLVRGHIVRKQTEDMLRRMQTLVRVQARARASRTRSSASLSSSSKSFHSRNARCGSNSNFGDIVELAKAKSGSTRLDRWMEGCSWNSHGNTSAGNRRNDDDRSAKILQVDKWEPNIKSQRSSRMFQTPHQVLTSAHLNQSFMAFGSPSKLSTKTLNKMQNFKPREASSLNSLKLSPSKDEAIHKAAENSPHVLSASSRPGSSNGRGPFTPTRSECSWGFVNGYYGCPNYMANTESFRAKVRSQSAPRQRIEFERYGSTKTSFQGFHDTENLPQRNSCQNNDFRTNAYPTSGRSNRLGSATER